MIFKLVCNDKHVYRKRNKTIHCKISWNKVIRSHTVSLNEVNLSRSKILLQMENEQDGLLPPGADNMELQVMDTGTSVSSPGTPRLDKESAIYKCVTKDGMIDLQILINTIDVGGDNGEVKYRNENGNTALHELCQNFTKQLITDSVEQYKILFPPRKNLVTREINLMKLCPCGLHIRKDEQIWFDAATSTNSHGYNILDLLLLVERNLDERFVGNIHDLDNSADIKKLVRENVLTTVQYLFKETDMFYLLKLLRNKSGDNNGSNVMDSPFRRLLKLYPETLPDLMDRCIVKCTGTTHYHFEILDDTYFLHTWPPREEYYCKWLYQFSWSHISETEKEYHNAYSDHLSQLKSNHPVMLMLKHKRDETDSQKKKIYKQLLDHKLLTALRRHKWLHFGRKFHILSFILYILFLSILTTFVVEINSLNVRFPESTTSDTTGYIYSTVCTTTYVCHNSSVNCNSTTNCYNTSSYNVTATTQNIPTCITYGNYPSITGLQVAVIFLAIILLFKEIYFIAIVFGRAYFKQLKNDMKLITPITAIAFVINLSECEHTSNRENWQWILGTVAIFWAWTDLLNYLEKFDRVGIFVSMFKRIMKTFMINIFPIVGILTVAFSLAFMCVRQKQDHFKTLLMTLLSTLALMVDGFEYETMSDDNINVMTIASYLTSIFFLITMLIVIMNLMFGVAVRNVQDIYVKAIEEQSTLQIELILDLEHICQLFLNALKRFDCTKRLRKWLKIKFMQDPNMSVPLRRLTSED